MGLLFILAAFLFFVGIAFITHVFLLSFLTRTWQVSGSHFKKALSTTLILVPVLVAIMVVIGMVVAGGMSGSLAGVLYFGITSVAVGYVVHWMYKAPFKNAIRIGIIISLLSSAICITLAYLISSLSFS